MRILIRCGVGSDNEDDFGMRCRIRRRSRDHIASKWESDNWSCDVLQLTQAAPQWSKRMAPHWMTRCAGGEGRGYNNADHTQSRQRERSRRRIGLRPPPKADAAPWSSASDAATTEDSTTMALLTHLPSGGLGDSRALATSPADIRVHSIISLVSSRSPALASA